MIEFQWHKFSDRLPPNETRQILVANDRFDEYGYFLVRLQSGATNKFGESWVYWSFIPDLPAKIIPLSKILDTS